MKKILIVGTSLDGYIAQSREQVSTEWTSDADKKFFTKRSKEIGIMVMGKATYATMGRPLPGRISVVYAKESGLLAENNVTDLPLLAEAVKSKNQAMSTWIKENKLDEKPFYTDLPVDELVAFLEEKGFVELAICGGASIYKMFLEEGMVDEIEMTIEPIFFGGGVKLLGDSGLTEAWEVKLVSEELLENSSTLLLKLKVPKIYRPVLPIPPRLFSSK